MLNLNEFSLTDHLRAKPVIKYRRRMRIYSDGPDGLYYICSGVARTVTTNSNLKVITTGILGEGNVFGDSVLMPEGPNNQEQAQALTDLEVMRYCQEDIDKILASSNSADFYAAVARHFQLRAREQDEVLVETAHLNTRELLVYHLRRLAEQFGEVRGGMMVIPFPLTHELLSTVVHTSREIITHHLNVLRRDGFVRYSRMQLILTQSFYSEGIHARPVYPERLKVEA